MSEQNLKPMMCNQCGAPMPIHPDHNECSYCGTRYDLPPVVRHQQQEGDWMVDTTVCTKGFGMPYFPYPQRMV